MKKLIVSALIVSCCVFLSGCKMHNAAAPQMKSHSSRVKELQKKYESAQANMPIAQQEKYKVENDQLTIDLK